MKRTFFASATLAVCTAISFTVAAQEVKLPTSSPATTAASSVKANPAGALMTQLIGGLNPSAFTAGFAKEKTGFLKSLGAIGDIASASSLLAKLIGFIKPSMFAKGLNPTSLIKEAGTIKNLSGLGGVMGVLSQSLKPEAFSADWGKNKDGWLTAVRGLQ